MIPSIIYQYYRQVCKDNCGDMFEKYTHGVLYESVRSHVAEGMPPGETNVVRAASLAASVKRLRRVITSGSRELAQVDEIRTRTALKPGGWSPRQVLGHLIDSASNNHQRFVRALISGELK